MGDNFLPIITGVMMMLGILILIFILTTVPYIESSNLDKFCIGEGFDKGEYSATIFRESYCLKQDGKNLTRIMVKTCPDGDGYCFVSEVNEAPK